jgi:hypothetical protein
MKQTSELKRTPFKRKPPVSEPKQRTRKCALKTCRQPFQPRNMTHKVCSPECGLELARIERERADKADTRERLAKLKTRSDWVKSAQHAFNAYIRMRDQVAGHCCISSGKPLDWSGNAVDAGHYRSTGSAPHLRFNENNCHAQSKHDNRYLAGNAVEYRLGLIRRIGLLALRDLEADNTPRKYSIDDLKEIEAHYKLKLKQLKG